MKTSNIKLALWVSLSILLFNACANNRTLTPQTQTEKFNTLQDGKTTNDEVRIILGAPDAALTKGKLKTWIYRDQNNSKKQIYQLPKGLQGQGIILVFDATGVLKEHRQINFEELKTIQMQQEREKSSPIVIEKTEDPKPASAIANP